MPRDLPTGWAAALESGAIRPAHLVQLEFRSEMVYVWSGVGTLVWNGLSFLGVGSLGSVGAIVEGVDVRADGTSVTLSGIDPELLEDSLTDILIGGTAKRWIALFSENMEMITQPYLLFSGQVDEPSIETSAESVSITLNLENPMINHERASQRRYTACDQAANGYPDDSAFDWVEIQNDIALVWG
jgi:hypothetical protein